MSRTTRILSSALVFGAVAIGGVFLGAGSAHAEGEIVACTTKKFTSKKVEAACKDGGRKAAKAVMKKIVKEQKAAGNAINCKTCHKSLKTFDNTSNAVADLKKYLK